MHHPRQWRGEEADAPVPYHNKYSFIKSIKFMKYLVIEFIEKKNDSPRVATALCCAPATAVFSRHPALPSGYSTHAIAAATTTESTHWTRTLSNDAPQQQRRTGERS